MRTLPPEISTEASAWMPSSAEASWNSPPLMVMAAIGMERIVSRIDVENAARHDESDASLQPFGAVGRLLGAAAARDQGDVAAADRQPGFGLDAVHASRDVERAALDGNVTLLRILIVVGLQPVAASVDGDRAVLDNDRIPTPDPIVHGVDSDVAAGDLEVILAGDAVVVVSFDGQCAAAVDREIVLAKDRSVGFVGLGVFKDVLAPSAT